MSGSAAATTKAAAGGTGQQSLLEALMSLDGLLQGGMSGTIRDPSRVTATDDATLRLKATIERYFQF